MFNICCRHESAEGSSNRKVAARLLPGTDIILGIIDICKKYGVEAGYIPVCFGSLQKATYLYLEPKENVKIGAGYGDVHNMDGPVEMLGATGVICKRDGAHELHMHATLCDSRGTVFGGHLVKGENPVLTTCDLIIAPIEGVDFVRRLDEETELVQFLPRKRL